MELLIFSALFRIVRMLDSFTFHKRPSEAAVCPLSSRSITSSFASRVSEVLGLFIQVPILCLNRRNGYVGD